MQEVFERGEAIGLACKGVNLGKYKGEHFGQLTLVQIIKADGKINIFDVMINPSMMTCHGGLEELLQADHITKARN